MGNQVALYLTPSDLKYFEEDLRRRDAFVVIPYWSTRPQPDILHTLQIEAMGTTPLQVFLARPEDAPGIPMRATEHGRGWTVDSLHAPVVEFSRSFFDGRVLRQGRLFFDAGYYETNGSWVQKPSGFVEWAESVLRFARKALKRDPELQAYLGTEAARLRTAPSVSFLIA